MNRKTLWVVFMSALLALALIGCAEKETGSESEQNNGPSDQGDQSPVVNTPPQEEVKDPDPVKLDVYISGTSLTDTEFEKFLADPIRRKYPHMTLQLIRDGQGTTITDLVTAGDFPDIAITSNTSLDKYMRYQIPIDLAPLASTHNLDLSQIKPAVKETLALYSDSNELLGIPFSLNYAGLWYNIDLFDKFAEDYPRDLMTWEDTLPIARNLRVDDQLGCNHEML